MKFSYRSHPIIEQIEKKQLHPIYNFPSDVINFNENKDLIKEIFNSQCSGNPEIYYLTEPFIQAFERAGNSFTNSRLWKDVDNADYCFLSNGGSMLITIRPEHEEGKIHVFMTILQKGYNEESIIIASRIESLFYDDDGTDMGRVVVAGESGFISSEYQNIRGKPPIGDACAAIMLSLFIRYAKVEIKELGSNQKIAGVKCSYKNETKSLVRVFDSTWFTTLVKSDGFQVRGHFRLQPKKKDGEWTKELIWINEFEKHGYTRRAGILANQ